MDNRSQFVQEKLFQLQDNKYRDFHATLIPIVPKETIIGVRMPALRNFAKEFSRSEDAAFFLRQLPHKYYDENVLHGLLLNYVGDYSSTMEEIDRFLPYVDNWAVCDMLSPKVLSKSTDKLIFKIKQWISSPLTYTVRFAMGMLMRYYLDDLFIQDYPEMIIAVKSDEYYIKMMQAWYFATALAKQYDTAVTYIETRRLDKWTHNKSIQKAVESFRVTPQRKEYLKTLRIK